MKAIRMASGEYVWMLGNDDLLNPNALKKLTKCLIRKNLFVYINSSYLNKEYLDTFKHPFDKKFVKKMKKFQMKKSQLNFTIIDLKFLGILCWEFFY